MIPLQMRALIPKHIQGLGPQEEIYIPLLEHIGNEIPTLKEACSLYNKSVVNSAENPRNTCAGQWSTLREMILLAAGNQATVAPDGFLNKMVFATKAHDTTQVSAIMHQWHQFMEASGVDYGPGGNTTTINWLERRMAKPW